MEPNQEMEDKISYQSLWDMLYLSVCALHQAKPVPARVSKMALDKIYRLSRFHGMASIVCMALEDADAFAQAGKPGLEQAWKEEKAKAVRKNMLLDAERAQIFAGMEQMGIWYVPLKGIILQELYPKYGMRQMSDNDILYDVSQQKDLIRYMKERGYSVYTNVGVHDDVFKKPPVYNFEMHKVLFSKGECPIYFEHYKTIKDKLRKDGQGQYGYSFSDEDFYVYLTAHTQKHYMFSGVGLRFLMDAYVFLTAKEKNLDWDYIAAELQALGILAFEKQARELAMKLFSEHALESVPSLTEEEQEMFLYFAESGTYGTMKKRVQNRLQELQPEGAGFTRASRWKYLKKRLFPEMEWFQNCYPFLARHKILIPFFLAGRMVRGILFRRDIIKDEFKAVKKAEKEP